MNEKIKSLIKNDSFLLIYNTSTMFSFMIFAILGPILSLLAIAFEYSVVSIIVFFLIMSVLFDLEFNTTYAYDENIKDYVKMLPVNREDYIKAKFFYGVKVILRDMLIIFISTEYLIRNIESINLILFASALMFISGAFSVRNFFTKDNKKLLKRNENLAKIAWLIPILVFNLSIYFSEKLKSIGVNLGKILIFKSLNPSIKGQINIKGIILLIMSIVFYFLIMLLTIKKGEKK